MKLEHWQNILRTHRQVLSLLDQSLPAESAEGEARTQVRVGLQGLVLLQQQLLGEIAGLRNVLGAAYREEEVDEALRPFVYLIDELVLRRLADSEQSDWPLLQYKLFGLDSGGDRFYEMADEKLMQRAASPLVFELLHFCLTAGFEGRHAGNAARLREYKERLAARIPKPEAVPAPPPPVEQAPLVHSFPMRYYAASGFVVLALPVLLWWLSR
ncbi:DotU family type IV/VI secretion system protein [Stigmatella sp. ncwal1]|uniref:DotU family type IV/VI secretion system protein n=1 Tax=Stigmatella ashevillensis TaxID=2995309 RepID=A0ABT5DIV0_9BACT|nr:DotU family type IV/VI secretion system protein [Stigmatella ashevillena]MDC0713592.1 DotU family type IV/VI secretion system protein [Stigmatella ashevillena]